MTSHSSISCKQAKKRDIRIHYWRVACRRTLNSNKHGMNGKLMNSSELFITHVPCCCCCFFFLVGTTCSLLSSRDIIYNMASPSWVEGASITQWCKDDIEYAKISQECNEVLSTMMSSMNEYTWNPHRHIERIHCLKSTKGTLKL